MDSLFETNSDLLKFLNRYIPEEIDSVVAVTVISSHSQPLYDIGRHFPRFDKYWDVEVVCKPGQIDECTQFKILDTLPKFIKLFGEQCNSVNTKIRYVSDSIYIL